jgi:hypothetical protein
MSLPKSYKDLTIEKYQEIYPLIQGINELAGLEYLERWGAISLAFGHDNLQISQIKELAFLTKNEYTLLYKHLWINGWLYRACNDVDQTNAAQILSIKTFLTQGDHIEQLHNIAACSYKKLTWRGWKYKGEGHVKLAAAFKKKSCHKVLPVVFFCFNVLKNVMLNSEAYLQSMRIIKNRMEEIRLMQLEKNFTNIGGGLPQ